LLVRFLNYFNPYSHSVSAHEGKIHHRLANLAKIKAELTVDDFLSNDDPRVMAEGLSLRV
jgi:hypothetical protein